MKLAITVRFACWDGAANLGAMGGVALLGLTLASGCTHAGQTGDFSFRPPIEEPAYGAGEGPLVLIDESHCNFHTEAGRYEPFAELLRRDGFTVEPMTAGFSARSLATADVLVVANAMPEERCDRWKLPTASAFGQDEVEALDEWVEQGGSLLLIADHMPFPGAAEDLAHAFGLVFISGYVRPDEGGSQIRFERALGTLGEHAITRGRSEAEQVEAVVSFTGQGFRAIGAVESLLTLPAETIIRLPSKHSKINEKTPSFSAEGLLQGVVLRHGEGRVAVFGEAAMFSAQEYTRDGELRQMGMNAPGAEGNVQFALNLLHWLAGLLD